MAMLNIPEEHWEALLEVVRNHKREIEGLKKTIEGLVQAHKEMREAHNMVVDSFNQDLENMSEDIGYICGYIGIEMDAEPVPVVIEPDCPEKEEASNVVPISKKVLH